MLDDAGLVREADIKPASLRHWAGRRAFENGSSIQEVARMLGCRTLDPAAKAIGLDWRGAESPVTSEARS